MTSLVILFSFLFTSSYLARRIDPKNASLQVIALLVVVLLTVELLSAFRLLSSLSLLVAGLCFLAVILALEWRGSALRNVVRWREIRTLFPRTFPTPDALPLAVLLFVLAIIAVLVPIAEIDSVSYHLPIASQLLKTGSAWDVFQAGFVGPNTYFPANHEALQAFLMAVFGGVQLNCIVTFLGVLLLYQSLRTLTDQKVSGGLIVVAMLSVCSIPFLFRQFLHLQIDLFLLCLLGSATAFLLSGILHRRRIDALQCFLVLGLALGTKYNALTHVIILLPFFLWLAVRLRAPVREWWWFPALSFLTGGFWYVRNGIVAGNPLYPFGIDLLGWEGHKRILADMSGTSLFDTAASIGWSETLRQVLQNNHFSAELGMVALAMLPLAFALALLLILLAAYEWFIGGRGARKAEERSSALPLWTGIGLLYLLCATAFVYLTSPYTFTLWNEVVRYSAGFFAMIPVLLAYALFVRSAFLTVLISLSVSAITGYHLLFTSLLVDTAFTSFFRDMVLLSSDRTLVLLVLLLALVFLVLLMSTRASQLPEYALGSAFLALTLLLFASVLPPRTTADDAYLYQKLTGYARLLPVLERLRQEGGGGAIALAGLTPYWLFEKEGFTPQYLHVDGCDDCTYPDYRSEEASVRAHPDEQQWKDLVRKRGIAYVLVDTVLSGSGVLTEQRWADADPLRFQPLLRADGLTLYRLSPL